MVINFISNERGQAYTQSSIVQLIDNQFQSEQKHTDV